MEEISAPEIITSEHNVSQFECGNESLNEYLQKKALKTQNSFAKTYVVCSKKNVIAYYTLTVGSINREEITKKMQRNAPKQIGVVLLARLAVDENWQGKGIAKSLLIEAILKTVEVSNAVGVAGLLVHAVDENAIKFYKKHEFLECPIADSLILPLQDILNILG
jgi:GNAT superfamily N-acetyltransferase